MIYEVLENDEIDTTFNKYELKHYLRKYNDVIEHLETYYIYTDIEEFETVISMTNAYFNTVLFDNLICGKYRVYYNDNESMKIPAEYYMLRNKNKALKVLVKM